MSFLDTMPAEIMEALGPEFRSADIMPPASAWVNGNVENTYLTNVEVKALRVSYERTYRSQNNIPDTDSMIIVLREGLTVSMSQQHRIRYDGVVYSVMTFDEDPAQATWSLQVRPVK